MQEMQFTIPLLSRTSWDLLFKCMHASLYIFSSPSKNSEEDEMELNCVEYSIQI